MVWTRASALPRAEELALKALTLFGGSARASDITFWAIYDAKYTEGIDRSDIDSLIACEVSVIMRRLYKARKINRGKKAKSSEYVYFFEENRPDTFE